MTDRYIAEFLISMADPFGVDAPGFVDVADGWVVGSGPLEAAPPLAEGGREHRLDGVLMPGLVDGHAHSSMTVLRGAGEGLPLDRWLADVIWPREARLGSDDVHVGMVMGAAEMLLGGVTTTNEMYFMPEAVVSGSREAGIRSIVNAAVVDAPGVDRFGSAAEMILRAIGLRDRYAGDDLVEIGFGPHSAYAVSDDALVAIAEAARAESMPLHLHVAETRTEGDAVMERTGVSPTVHLARLGVLDGRVSAAHCVWVDDADIAVLAEHAVGVAHCPGSNGKLASGIAPVAAMRQAGLHVCAATDGPASNNDLDLWEEARLALLYARLRGSDALALDCEAALRMVTSEAAAALGRPDLGALVPGRRADMIRVSLDHVAFSPILTKDDVVSHLVWAGSARDVGDVWVSGRHVVEGRRLLTVDLVAARAALQKAAARIAG